MFSTLCSGKSVLKFHYRRRVSEMNTPNFGSCMLSEAQQRARTIINNIKQLLVFTPHHGSEIAGIDMEQIDYVAVHTLR